MSTICLRFLSWNLKDFGYYDYSATMPRIAKTVLNDGADIFVIMEVAVNRKAKGKILIGKNPPSPLAVNALDKLLSELNTQDTVSNWKYVVSNINAGNKKRDAYAFFWKSTPAGATTDPLFATAITYKQGPDILRKDGSGKDLEFGSSRRPAACLFELTNNNAAPDKQDLWVVAFHNADGKSVKTLQNALSDCFSACDAVRGTTPLIIGSDTNLDYNNPENADFYKGIFGATGYEVGITDGVGTSLLAKVNGDGAVAGKAFDNIFTKGLTSYAGKDPEVINVIEDIANEMQLKPPKGKKRTKSEDLNAGFNEYATKKSKVDGDDVIGPGGISDHLPVAGVFRFT